MQLQAFNNDEVFRQQMIEAAVAHRLADEFIAGTYVDRVLPGGGFRGCSVGCSLYDVQVLRGYHRQADYGDHALLARELGLPQFLVRLQDTIFEGLPEVERYQWTERLYRAIPVGADLTTVLPKFLLRILDDLPKTNRPDVTDAVNGVRVLLREWTATGEVDLRAAAGAAGAAYAAAGAARAAAAAYAAAGAAAAAAAAYAAAGAAAAAAAWVKISDHLIEAIQL